MVIYIMSFSNKKIIETIQKGGEAGHLGLRRGSKGKHKDINKIVPELTINGFANLMVKSKYNKKKQGSVASRNMFEIARFKENQYDYSGLGSGQLTDTQFRNVEKITYDPFANASGVIATMGGANKGGDSELPLKRPVKRVKPKNRFKTTKNIKHSQITQPNPFPPIFKPNTRQSYGNVKIKCKTYA